MSQMMQAIDMHHAHDHAGSRHVVQRTVIIGLTAFLTVVDLFATQAILPTLAQHYGVTPAAMGFAVNASTIGMAVAGLSTALFASLSATTGIPSLTTDAIAGISTEDIYALTSEQGSAFAQTQIDAMNFDQVTALIDVITA